MSTKTTPSALPAPSPEPGGPNFGDPNAETWRFLEELIEVSRRADGQPPFSDASLVELRRGERHLKMIEHAAAAIVSEGEAEFVVMPDDRGRGLGTRLLDSLLAASAPGLLIWAHGDHPAARALAASHGLKPVRRLLQLRRSLPAPNASPLTHTVAAFRPGADDATWLDLNARAFASHPEQGSLTQGDLDELKRQAWFDPDDFLLIREENPEPRQRSNDIIAYCWLKVEDGVGEFYVVGVDPDRQGAGLGRALMTAGFARLEQRGIRIAALYVEADNIAAVTLYRSLGFTDYSVDIQYVAG